MHIHFSSNEDSSTVVIRVGVTSHSIASQNELVIGQTQSSQILFFPNEDEAWKILSILRDRRRR